MATNGIEAAPSLVRLCGALCMALLGFIILLSFPMLTLASIYAIPNAFSPSHIDIAQLGMYCCLVTLGLAISYHTFTIKFDDNLGIPLQKQHSEKLCNFLNTHTKQSHRLCGKIHTAQISEKHELKIIKVPVFGIPVWSKNVLVIGLSYMQLATQKSFEQALTSTLSRLVITRHPLLHWVVSLRYVWEQYPVALRKRNSIGDLFLADFFNAFSRIYKRLTLPLVKQTRLLGDEYNRDIHNHYDLLEGIQVEMANEVYMRHYHWPRAMKALYNNHHHLPEGLNLFQNLPDAIEEQLGADALIEVFTNLYNKQDFTAADFPSIKQRIDVLGHEKINRLKPWKGEAANYYLERDYPHYVAQIEQRWMERYLRSRRDNLIPANTPSINKGTKVTEAQT